MGGGRPVDPRGHGRLHPHAARGRALAANAGQAVHVHCRRHPTAARGRDHRLGDGIESRNDGGEGARSDDVLLSLALTLPKKKDEEEEDPEKQEEEASEKKPEGRYFVHRKEDKSGAIYEVAIPWALFAKNGAQVVPGQVPPKGFTFGLNVCLTDDDGDRADVADPDSDGRRGALKVLELTPGLRQYLIVFLSQACDKTR